MRLWDIVVVGAGPGGLQAAIAAASEGLSTLVLEKHRVGGQIGQTPLLENSVFANGGVTGPQFAEMMRSQAVAMGATIEMGEVTELAVKPGQIKHLRVKVHGREEIVRAHVVILALGMKWTELNVPGVKENLGNGVHIGPLNAIKYVADGYVGGGDVIVYGGGPSAGQAILALAQGGHTVHALMRSTLKMPQYLVDRIRGHRRVNVLEHSQIVEIDRMVSGPIAVEYVTQGRSLYLSVGAVFMCNGLTPQAGWLPKTIERDEHGQIVTEAGGTSVPGFPGIFAVGDCRSGSTPRVGVAIGDGSMAVTEAWRYFNKYPKCERCSEILPAAKVAVRR